ncbi:MAG: hypothetical protein KC646_15945, partial [Candidatus Cloacimonetes bacterium]|nr:hypothetical protein [Candidatus Cloacimonadota bacterium]
SDHVFSQHFIGFDLSKSLAIKRLPSQLSWFLLQLFWLFWNYRCDLSLLLNCTFLILSLSVLPHTPNDLQGFDPTTLAGLSDESFSGSQCNLLSLSSRSEESESLARCSRVFSKAVHSATP